MRVKTLSTVFWRRIWAIGSSLWNCLVESYACGRASLSTTSYLSLSIASNISMSCISIWEQDVSAKTFRQRRFVSGKETRDFPAIFLSRNVPYYLGPVLSWFCFWFSTNWLGLVCRIPVCRILELTTNDKTINIPFAVPKLRTATTLSK